MKITILIIVILLIAFLKLKLDMYILAMWISDKKYPLPDKKYVEQLAKKVTERWFKK